MKNNKHFNSRTVTEGSMIVTKLNTRSNERADFLINSSHQSILCQCLDILNVTLAVGVLIGRGVYMIRALNLKTALEWERLSESGHLLN